MSWRTLSVESWNCTPKHPYTPPQGSRTKIDSKNGKFRHLYVRQHLFYVKKPENPAAKNALKHFVYSGQKGLNLKK